MPDFTPDPDAVEEMARILGYAIQRKRGRPEWDLGGFYEGNEDDLHAAADAALRHAHAAALRAAEQVRRDCEARVLWEIRGSWACITPDSYGREYAMAVTRLDVVREELRAYDAREAAERAGRGE